MYQCRTASRLIKCNYLTLILFHVATDSRYINIQVSTNEKWEFRAYGGISLSNLCWYRKWRVLHNYQTNMPYCHANICLFVYWLAKDVCFARRRNYWHCNTFCCLAFPALVLKVKRFIDNCNLQNDLQMISYDRKKRKAILSLREPKFFYLRILWYNSSSL